MARFCSWKVISAATQLKKDCNLVMLLWAGTSLRLQPWYKMAWTSGIQLEWNHTYDDDISNSNCVMYSISTYRQVLTKCYVSQVSTVEYWAHLLRMILLVLSTCLVTIFWNTDISIDSSLLWNSSTSIRRRFLQIDKQKKHKVRKHITKNLSSLSKCAILLLNGKCKYEGHCFNG